MLRTSNPRKIISYYYSLKKKEKKMFYQNFNSVLKSHPYYKKVYKSLDISSFYICEKNLKITNMKYIRNIQKICSLERRKSGIDSILETGKIIYE